MQLAKYWQHTLATSFVALMMAGCGTTPKAPVIASATIKAPAQAQPVLPAAGSGRGGYYKDDGPADNPPENLMTTPDAVPKVEPQRVPNSKPYVVFGKTYTPITDNKPFMQRGLGTWYGKKFHGQKTSSGERYDMFKMTAAHPTLPIPSYARVTNLSNGAQVIVRINDRGPFHSTRVIDLSYTAALKLGYLSNGSGTLEVERLLPEDIARINLEKNEPRQVVQNTVAPASMQVAPAVVAIALPPDERSIVSAIAALPEAPAAEKIVSSGASNASIAASGIYLQFGAFAQMANAEATRNLLLPAWSSRQPPLEVVGAGALYRVTSGPFATRQEAEAVARQASASHGVKPVIVLR
jgi:rare lipoprotein A